MRYEVSHFNDTSDSYSKEYGRITTDGYSFRVRREKVLALVPKAEHGAEALDVACGPGVMAEGLHRKGYRVTSTDAAPHMIEVAQRVAGHVPESRFLVADVYDLPLPDHRYGVVTAMGLMEYLEDQNRAIEEMKRVTREGGALIITFPYKWSPWRIFNRMMLSIVRPLRQLLGRSKDEPSLNHREYTPREVITLLRSHDLSVANVWFYNFKLVPYPLDQRFPRFTVWQSRLFEKLDRTLFKFLGTAFIVKAQRSKK